MQLCGPRPLRTGRSSSGEMRRGYSAAYGFLATAFTLTITFFKPKSGDPMRCTQRKKTPGFTSGFLMNGSYTSYLTYFFQRHIKY